MKVNRKFFKAILCVSLIIVLGGFIASFFVSNKIDERERRILEIRADNASLVFTSEEIKNLAGDEGDLNNAYYFDVKNKLLALRKANPDARFVYLMGERDGQMFFFADSESITSEDYSPPGQIYDEAGQSDIDGYLSGVSYSEGPYTDRWGNWVSGYSHIKDPVTGEVIAMLGMDVDASSWRSGVLIWRFVIAGITLLLCAYFALLLRGIWKTEGSMFKAESDHGEVLNWREKIKDFQEFGKVSIFKINPRDMKVFDEEDLSPEIKNKTISEIDGFVSESLSSNIILGKEEFSLVSERDGEKVLWRFEVRYDAGMNPIFIKVARVKIS